MGEVEKKTGREKNLLAWFRNSEEMEAEKTIENGGKDGKITGRQSKYMSPRNCESK